MAQLLTLLRHFRSKLKHLTVNHSGPDIKLSGLDKETTLEPKLSLVFNRGFNIVISCLGTTRTLRHFAICGPVTGLAPPPSPTPTEAHKALPRSVLIGRAAVYGRCSVRAARVSLAVPTHGLSPGHGRIRLGWSARW